MEVGAVGGKGQPVMICLIYKDVDQHSTGATTPAVCTPCQTGSFAASSGVVSVVQISTAAKGRLMQ
jgi:hypothetical protein